MLKDGPSVPDWTVARAAKGSDTLIAAWPDGLEWEIPDTASGQSAAAADERAPATNQVYKGTTSDGTVVTAKTVSHRNKGIWYQVVAGRQQLSGCAKRSVSECGHDSRISSEPLFFVRIQ
jgi:hypothetical protein